MCKIFTDWSPHLRPAAVSSVMTPTSAPGSGAAAAAADKSTLKVYLPNGGFNVVKFGDATDIRGIIALLTCRLGGGRRGYSHLYSMRLVNTVTGDIHCLHQDTTMFQVSSTSNQHNRITKIFSFPSIFKKFHPKVRNHGRNYHEGRAAFRHYANQPNFTLRDRLFSIVS